MAPPAFAAVVESAGRRLGDAMRGLELPPPAVLVGHALAVEPRGDDVGASVTITHASARPIGADAVVLLEGEVRSRLQLGPVSVLLVRIPTEHAIRVARCSLLPDQDGEAAVAVVAGILVARNDWSCRVQGAQAGSAEAARVAAVVEAPGNRADGTPRASSDEPAADVAAATVRVTLAPP